MNDPMSVPYEAKNIIASRARMGLIALATDHVIEHELNKFFNGVEGVQLYTTKVPMVPSVTTDTLKSMDNKLHQTAKTLLPGNKFSVVGYGCTSASIVIGEDKVFQTIKTACQTSSITTPITACLAALKTLRGKNIGLVTPYVGEVNSLIKRYFEAHDYTVTKSITFSEIDDNRAGKITPTSISDAVMDQFSLEDIDFVFISCTSLRAFELVPILEGKLQCNVTTSNHALAWHMLRLSGIYDKYSDKGKLFRN
tara:strand:+ start:881 stop:1639 length:759 start_codon:yes stop_codon:yes gene_type:complete